MVGLIKVLGLVLLAQGAFAQGVNTATVNGTVTKPAPAVTLTGGFKSYNDSGRMVELNTPNSRLMKSRNEFFFGAKLATGWGFTAQGVENYQINSGKAGSVFSMSDPSLTISHPNIYESQNFKITGAFRQYVPVSSYSVGRNLWQEAYYFGMTWKLPNRFEVNNLLIPRYFWASKYQGKEATFFTEDFTTISRQVKPWMRVGFGQHTQFEVHSDAPLGRCIELYPYADFMLSSSIYFGPRLFIDRKSVV